MIVITIADFQQLLVNDEIKYFDAHLPYMRLRLRDGLWLYLHERDIGHQLQEMTIDRTWRELHDSFFTIPSGFEPDYGTGDPLYARSGAEQRMPIYHDPLALRATARRRYST